MVGLTRVISTIWRYSKDTLAMEVIAARDIEIGEEITHSCKGAWSLLFKHWARDTNTASRHIPRHDIYGAPIRSPTMELHLQMSALLLLAKNHRDI